MIVRRWRMPHPRPVGRLIALIALAGCGGSAAPAAKSASEPAPTRDEEPPQSIAQAEEQIARARASLDGTAKTETAESTISTRSKKAADPSAAAGPEDRCASPCRALSSMRRAVDALCRLAGDTDARCAEARRTLTESTARVASCACK